MLKNYFVTALRNLKRNKLYTTLNVFGLALGIGCALVIFKVIQYEITFDHHHENYDRIYRVVHEGIYPDRIDKSQGVPHPLGPARLEEYPSKNRVVRTEYQYGNQVNTYREDGSYNKFLIEDGMAFTEPEFFDIFTVNWVAGDPETALTEPNTVVIATSEARKLFGLPEGEEHKSLGELINVSNIADFKVVGVIENFPTNTSLPFKYLFEYSSQKGDMNPYFFEGTSWNSMSSNTNVYFIPEESFSTGHFNTAMLDLVEKYRGEGRSAEDRFVAQRFDNIRFNEDYGAYNGTTSMEFIYALAVIGIFLVITACINFINMATAQASVRSKEIGIRKAIGGTGGQLVVQFFSEIALISFFALILSLAIAEIMFTTLEDIIGYKLAIGLLDTPVTLIFLGITLAIVSFLSGFYPAILLSRMNTIEALRNNINIKKYAGALPLRKALVILQFAISQFLIIGTLIITSQTEYFFEKDLGFQTKAILTTYLPERDEVKMERFRMEMLTSPAIEGVTFGLSEPTGNSDSHSNFNYGPMESEQDYHGNFKAVDEHYLDFFGINLITGRGVSKTDSAHVVINKRVADLLGFKDRYDEVLGETIETGWGGDKKVVGVIDNFHTYELTRGLDYVLMVYYPKAFYSLSFKTKSMNSLAEAKAHFESTWEKVFPEYVVKYDFYDKTLEEKYESILKTNMLIKIFAIISILIGCLGLYGLISFLTANKLKEIGIRKVLGASTSTILRLFSREIITLIILAFFVTIPVAFYVLDNWLDNFAFRIQLGYGFFVLAFAITLLIALITISYKIITAARLNPAFILKDD